MIYILMVIFFYVQAIIFKHKYLILSFFASTLLLIFIFGGKYYNGWDWVNYQAYFTCAKDLYFTQAIYECENIGKFEIGFVSLIKLVQLFNFNFNILYLLIAIINIGCLNIFIKNNKIFDWPFIYSVFIMLFAWVLWMQALRQGLAFSFILLGVMFLSSNQKNKYVKTLISFLLATSMHISAIIPIFFIVYVYFFQTKYIKKMLYASFIIIPLCYFISIKIFDGDLLINKIKAYTESGYYLQPPSIANWVKYLFYLLIYYYVNQYKNNFSVYYYKIFSLYRMGIIFYPIFSLTILTARFNLYLMPFGIFLMAIFCNNKQKLIILNLAMVFFIMFTLSIQTKIDLFPFNNYFIDEHMLQKSLNYDEQKDLLQQKQTEYGIKI